MWLTLWRKTIFVNIYPLLLVCSKTVFLTNPNFPQDLSLFKHCKKKNFWVFQCSFLRLSVFWLKREFLYDLIPKSFKTTERYSLAVCGSLCGEKQFLLIFIPFYLFEQKSLFKKILIFLRICPFQTWSKKFSSEYFSARFWDSHFYA